MSQSQPTKSFKTRQYGRQQLRSLAGSSGSGRGRAGGRGYYVNKRENDKTSEGFRRSNRPLVPDNKSSIDKWEPKAISPNDMTPFSKHCVELSDEFIKLDMHLDDVKTHNPSNHDQLRLVRELNRPDDHPQKYNELIAECEANPNQFKGTYYCLILLFGEYRLRKYVKEQAWTKETLKMYDHVANWHLNGKDMTEGEEKEARNGRAVSKIPAYNGSQEPAW